MRGAFNLVLRKDLDGFDVRSVARMPSRDGGDARQGSVVWGGAVGAGHMTVGVDILNREEIAGMRRDNQPETSASIRMRRGKAAARNGGRA